MTAVKPRERFVFIDGLRGVAALGVMFHHLFNAELAGQLQSIFPRPLTWLLDQAVHGVQIFFVISGFVIAYSLRSTIVTASSATNFILRRQIRLDPVYWFVVFGTLLYTAAQALKHPAYRAALFPPSTILANMFYLQRILGRPDIVVVSWTLCLEVQFYLIYILILLFVQRSTQLLPSPQRRQGLILMAIMAVMLPISLWRHELETHDNAMFISTWYLFAIGVLICWVVERRIPALPTLAFVALLFAGAVYRDDPREICGCATAAIIFIASRLGTLTIWLSDRVMQYFGRISYSLYLVHWEVGHAALRIGIRLFGASPWHSVASFLFAAAACVGVAQLLNLLIERPSMNLASRLKSRPTVPDPLAARTPAAAAEATNPA